MISFSCSCGKTYQLPDRVAGREVRCNQCERTLLVPRESQTEPVVPLNDAPAATPSQETPEPANRDSAETQADSEAAAAPESPESDPPSRAATGVRSLLVPGVVLLVVAWFALCVFGFLVGLRLASSGTAVQPDGAELVRNAEAQAAALRRSASSRQDELRVGLTFPAAEAAVVVREPDAAARTAAMTSLMESRQKLEADWIAARRRERIADLLSGLSPALSRTPEDAATSPELDRIEALLQPPPPTAADWKIVAGRIPIPFAVQTADGAPALLSLDGNPLETAAGDRKEEVLSAVAAALSAKDSETTNDQKHELSFRIDSAGSRPVRLVWPRDGVSAELDIGTVKEFRFSFYLPEKANAVFKPGKPTGIDKTLELESLALRLSGDSGYIEFTPSDRATFQTLCEQARQAWAPLRIPMNGDPAWKRTDHGFFGPGIVRRIEWIVRPTGEGVTFWVDNLSIVEPSRN